MQRSLLRLVTVTSIAGLLLLAGCGADESYDGLSARRSPSFSADEPAVGFAPPSPATAASGASPSASDAGSVPDSEQIARKLIYTAEARLVVEEFDSVPAGIEELVRKHRGFIANSQLTGTRGERRSGTWQVRVPTDQFEAFLSATAALGEVRLISRKSQDVTEEFFDVEARIRNKRVQETGLLKILAERTGKLEDVLTVERELSRVREEMERMEGRVRLLSDLTTLATVNIHVEEIKNYVPEQTPSFTRRVTRSFTGSLDALRRTGENAAVAFVAAVPWLVSLAIFGLPILGLVRWSLRRDKSSSP